ncbi:hypothetical protein [Engelhardtia mirabilis]|uniref:Uncharacterized protein n=1 Tax=Engelhardtia mirabilis TaxID=2528011 RepID=A0A518BLT7_9BACT|nr:hypothetical protein Pla133_30270 [Planctomycetes bacterium Pla133]QDV02264.1 hypothetical protein Pla86_30260 [Planctomycetes bacterium Pla86]
MPQTVQDHGADLRVTPSDTGSYVARGTMPLGKGWTWTEDCPFGLRRGGKVYPAQWSPVAWDHSGSVAVVELAALVDPEPTLPADPDPIKFDVVQSDVPFAFAYPPLDPALVDLALSFGKLRLQVDDALGNIYAAPISLPLDSPHSEIEVAGRAKAVYHTTANLQLVKAVSPNPLAQIGGLQVWITLYAESNVLELDLRWHNATMGHQGEMAPDVLFKNVELAMPLGWRATSRWPLPTSGPVYDLNTAGRTKSALPIVVAGSTPHVLRQRGNLTWRFVVHPQGVDDQVQENIDRVGWGAVRGEVGGWQDPFARSWLAQRTLLPDLSVWENSLKSELEGDRAEIEFAFANGTPYLYTSGGVGQMGPFHSIGVKYGGMTGGAEIYQTPGADLMWTAENDGLVAFEMLHRMVHDRQYGWFFDTEGNLVKSFDLVDSNGALPVNVFNNEFLDVANLGALGFETVPDVYANVQPRPTYEDSLLGTDPYNGLEQYDAQHGARATYASKVLVWGANDRMARQDLINQAALWQMEFHEGPGGRLKTLYNWAKQNPHVAGEFGRGEAWILDAMSHWYAIADTADRARMDPWFQMVVKTLEKLRTPMGIFYGNRDGKITNYYQFQNKYAIIQWYEHEILMHTLACVLESWAADVATQNKLAMWLVEGVLACNDVGWKPGSVGTYDQQAVAWMDPSLPAFANLAQIPTDGAGGGPDADQIAGPVGLALPYALPQQAVQLFGMAQGLTGATDPLQGFESLYTYYLGVENRAPLLAWLQVILH